MHQIVPPILSRRAPLNRIERQTLIVFWMLSWRLRVWPSQWAMVFLYLKIHFLMQKSTWNVWNLVHLYFHKEISIIWAKLMLLKTCLAQMERASDSNQLGIWRLQVRLLWQVIVLVHITLLFHTTNVWIDVMEYDRYIELARGPSFWFLILSKEITMLWAE